MRLSLLQLRPLPDRIAKLKDVRLFAQLNKRELITVGRLLHEREYKAGEVIFDEGDEGQALYIIFSGEVIIVRKSRPDTPLADLGAGDFFGDLALIDSAPRAAQARAATDCLVGVLFRADFHNILETDPRTGSRLYQQLARHVGRLLRETVLGARGDHYL
jgi:CRP/FNR family transcriptional regulator, cyclic AMP receptor protein